MIEKRPRGGATPGKSVPPLCETSKPSDHGFRFQTRLATTGSKELTDNFINVAVIGVGTFGRNHARVYHQLAKQGAPVRLVGVVDPDTAKADAVAREFACRGFGSIDQLITTHSEVQAASVAVPTSHHLNNALKLMEASIDVLIEKPLATSLAEADELIRVAKRLGRIAQVGHLERFNPAVRATLPVITRPMFFEVHRLSVFTPRSLDVDVVLDLAIHDLDIVLSFVQFAGQGNPRSVGCPSFRARWTSRMYGSNSTPAV